MGHVDVLIVGAGLSGVGAACHLQKSCPGKSFAILEAREAIGGTWDLFRYPGVRSDSDMFTLGYSFKPWREEKAIADGASISSYIRETAREHGLEEKIRFNHRVLSAAWSSATSRWTVLAERTDTHEAVRLTCHFLLGCTGYYRYDEGYTPAFKGTERYRGRIAHPQHWPEDLDYAGKRVVVIGSGATAVTLVPAIAARAAHVTMVQRSPSYIVSLPARDPVAGLLRRTLPAKAAYSAVRWKNVLLAQTTFQLSRRAPSFMRAVLRRGVRRLLPPGFDVDTHFKPRYQPWDERVCFVPDGDLFKALREGKASIVTDTIEGFTEQGLELGSGARLEADVIITATGLNLLALGGMALSVDGQPIEISKTVGYKGLMLSGVPNLAIVLGYTNASWTLKGELTCEYVCRLLNHMDEHGLRQCTPRPPDPAMPTEPFIDFKSGYVQRGVSAFPRQGSRAPWRLFQSYAKDVRLLRHGPLADEALEFSS